MIKTCCVCKKKKTLSQFYLRGKSGDPTKVNTRCKKCSVKRSVEYSRANRERKSAWDKTYQKAHPEVIKAMSARRRLRDALKIKARALVNAQISRGVLKRQRCEKCRKIGHAHHEDYNKPFAVRWFCRKHHDELHRNYKKPKLLGDL